MFRLVNLIIKYLKLTIPLLLHSHSPLRLILSIRLPLQNRAVAFTGAQARFTGPKAANLARATDLPASPARDHLFLAPRLTTRDQLRVIADKPLC
jgi:hypothetical protein